MREKLIEKIEAQPNGPKDSLPVVSLEDFFEGNDDSGSIGCNLEPILEPDFFYQVLKDIRDKESTQDILVEIYEVMDEEDAWPFSERVYIISSETAETIEKWLVQLEPSDICTGWQYGTPAVAPEVQEGMTVYAVWWD